MNNVIFRVLVGMLYPVVVLYQNVPSSTKFSYTQARMMINFTKVCYCVHKILSKCNSFWEMTSIFTNNFFLKYHLFNPFSGMSIHLYIWWKHFGIYFLFEKTIIKTRYILIIFVNAIYKCHNQNRLLSILKKLLIVVGSSAPSHLVFGILRFRTNIWHVMKAFG